MIHSIKNIAFALAATCMLTAAAQAQSTSSSWSKSWSSSSGSSWGTRADGTSYRTGFNNSDSQSSASTTTRNGLSSNTTSVNQRQSSRNGFSASNGPGGIHQSAYNNNSGSQSIVNTRRQGGLYGNVTDTRSLNSQYSNRNSMSRGIGPGGIYNNRLQTNSGSTTIGRNIASNSLFGPSVRAGSTRTVGFRNQQGYNRGLNSGGLYNNTFNNQNVTTSGSNFFRVFP